MKKRIMILTTALIVALLFVSISAVSAKPDSPGVIQCVTNIAYDEHPDGFYWSGPVTGCILEGTIEYRAVDEEYFESGKTLHFSETFKIELADGEEIYGKNRGVWNFSTLKFRANGWVTDATEDWEHLIGYKFHEMGTTTNPDVLPITADNTKMMLAPANRSSR